MNSFKTNHIIIFILILYASFTGPINAQQDNLNASKDSFKKNIHYLSTTYLDHMQGMTRQTENNLIRMTQTLYVSIATMVNDNNKSLQLSSSQLNREIFTQLLPEMKELRKKLLLMNDQVTMKFNQQ
jgi:hypothetical protein